jgi:chemotaxis protein MotB
MVFALNYRVSDSNAADVRNCLVRLLQANATLSDQINAKVNKIQADVRRGLEALEFAADQRRRLVLDLRETLRNEGITVDVDERNGVVRLTEQAVRFAPNDFHLIGAARENVIRISRALGRVISQYAACRADTPGKCSEFRGAALDTIFVEGHTDSTGGVDSLNWQLATNRATETYQLITNASPELRQFRNSRNEEIVSVAGYSSTRPIDTRETHEAWAKNRRIDLRFVMDAEKTINFRDLIGLNDDIKAQIAELAKQSKESLDQCR